MKKIVFCFSIIDVSNRIDNYDTDSGFDDRLEMAVNSIKELIYGFKSFDFEIELFTDVATSRFFKELPIDRISLDLEFINSNEIESVERKMLCLAKQSVPFLYLDWDISLSKEIIKGIYHFDNDQDVIVASKYGIAHSSNVTKSLKITYGELKTFSWLMDIKGEYVDEFVNNHEYAYDTKIIGFNNLDLKNVYVNNFLKCLNVAKSSKQLSNPILIIQDYLLYITVLSQNGSCNIIFKGKSKLTSVKNNHSCKETVRKTHNDSNQSPEISNIDRLFKNMVLNKNGTALISLCTVVMNRFDHISRTLKYNIKIAYKFKGIININLLDYNSEDGLEDFLFKQNWFKMAIEDGILFYYKNYDQQFYHRTLPKNYIHFLSNGLYLINIDADNYISESYITYCLSIIKKKKNFFLRPSLLSSVGSFGRIMIKSSDFKKIGGYHLGIENYGFEDTEITLRLRKIGLNQHLAPFHLCNDSIGHSDSLRFLNQKRTSEANDKDVSSSDYQNRKFKIQFNPNKGNNSKIVLFRLDEKKIKTKIDVSHSYFLD